VEYLGFYVLLGGVVLVALILTLPAIIEDWRITEPTEKGHGRPRLRWTVRRTAAGGTMNVKRRLASVPSVGVSVPSVMQKTKAPPQNHIKRGSEEASTCTPHHAVLG
jgi:hypothetical protein